MDLNLIKKPVITEKSTANAQFNKYIFEVTKSANKSEIKATIEELFDVEIQHHSLYFYGSKKQIKQK